MLAQTSVDEKTKIKTPRPFYYSTCNMPGISFHINEELSVKVSPVTVLLYVNRIQPNETKCYAATPHTAT